MKKTRVLAILLVIMAAMVFMTPPTFAYNPEPMFGLNWRPDACTDGTSGVKICLDIYLYVVEMNNLAIDYALAECTGGSCFSALYTQYMGGVTQSSIFGHYPDDEISSWIVCMFNYIEDEVINLYADR